MQKLIQSPRIALPLLGLIGLVAYVAAPVCLPNNIVERIDIIAFGFAVLIALPWLAACLETLEIGGLKAKLRAIEDKADAATETAASARELVDEVAMSERSDKSEENLVELTQDSDESPATEEEKDKAIERLHKLCQRYVSIRESMPPGAARTAKMTEIFGLLERTAKTIPQQKSVIEDWLSGGDPGHQLAAIAWLRSNSKYIKPGRLIETIEKSNQPFVQYWALRVLDGHVKQSGVTYFTPRDLLKLRQLEGVIRVKTDRWQQLRRINMRLSDAF